MPRLFIALPVPDEIADDLVISIKTVEVHRARVMEKMGVDSVAELVRRTLATKKS